MRFRKASAPGTRITFDRLERGSLTIVRGTIEGTADDVSSVLLELLGRPPVMATRHCPSCDGHSCPDLSGLPILSPGEPVPEPGVDGTT